METTYRLVNISARERDSRGYYAYGKTAASPELAKLMPGGMIVEAGDLIGVEKAVWKDIIGSQGQTGKSVVQQVLVEAEKTPGEWGINRK